MNRAVARVGSWGGRWGLEELDVWFLALRVAAFLGGVGWWALAPDPTRHSLLVVLVVFALFSAGIYLVNGLCPGHIERLYRAALVFDLAVIFALIRITGGFASDLYLAFILLIALHAFYFGLVTGLAVAAAATGLYTLAVSWPAPVPGFPLRVAFFGLVGLCLGVVGSQARRRQAAVDHQQEQLIHSDRLATVGELAAGLAHELRNPLAGISGALHVLESQLDSSEGGPGLLADLQAQIGRMNKTLTDLLQHARPPRPERIAVEINALIEQSLQFVPRSAIQVVRRFDDSLPPAYVDPGLLHQVFLNIFVNARQAMPHGGRLTVETRRRDQNGGATEIRISDTGVGIAREHVQRIFQPFFTTKAQGTGLGLAIAARVIEQHGGRIEVESTTGHGTTFTIVLPGGPPGDPTRSQSHATQSAGR